MRTRIQQAFTSTEVATRDFACCSSYVLVVLFLRAENGTLQDTLGRVLGADEGELGVPLEQQEAHVAVGAPCVSLYNFARPRVQQLVDLLRLDTLRLEDQ